MSTLNFLALRKLIAGGLSHSHTVFDSLELFRAAGKTIVSQPKCGEEVGDGWALTESRTKEARCSILPDGLLGSRLSARH
jgi:hypothetical protein